VYTNLQYSSALNIPQSAAITCVKPSGTVSQLVDSASVIHTRHNPYYIRRVRGDKKDPLSQFMIDKGVPAEDCVMRPESTVVFSFPQKSPEGARTREALTAIQHLELWMQYQRHYCEHKPSVTISVKEDEWLDVGAWVWKNFDEISGISFLPYDGGTYRQAPYEDCTKEQYEELLSKMPTHIDWDSLVEYDDNVEGVQTLACSGASCEI
jgi:ribonucleoside-diphosphate reductase alpha chain